MASGGEQPVRVEPEDVSPDIGDFGCFKVKLRCEMTLEDCLAIATVLGYPPADIDEMKRSDGVGHHFVTMMEGRGHISDSTIEPLTDALTTLGYDGIRTKVDFWFNKHVRKITPQEDCDEGSDTSSEDEDDDDKPMTNVQRSYLDRLCTEWIVDGTNWKPWAGDLRERHVLTGKEYKKVKQSSDNQAQLSSLFTILKTKPAWVLKLLKRPSIGANVENDILTKLQRWTTMKIPDNLCEEINMQPTGTINVVLIGKTGSGKSSTGNTLLGNTEFKESKWYWRSCSKHVEMKETVEQNVTLKVMDTPGLFDTDPDRKNCDVFLEFTKIALQFPEGIHVFIIVCRKDATFTKEERETISELEQHFGRTFFQRSMLVFTRGDTIPAKEDLAESMEEAPEELKRLFQNVSRRALAIDNGTSDGRTMIRMQRLWLILAIEKLAREGEPYQEEIISEIGQITDGESNALNQVLQTTLCVYAYLRDEVIARSNEEALMVMLGEERLPDQDLERLRKDPKIARSIELLGEKKVTLEKLVRNGLKRYKADIELTLNVSEEFRKKIHGVVRQHINTLTRQGVRELSNKLSEGEVPPDLVDKLYDTKSLCVDVAMTRDEIKMVVKTVITSNLNIIDKVMTEYWKRVPFSEKYLSELCIII